MRRIGVMLATPRDEHFLPVIADALRARGWSPGGDLLIETRRTDGTVSDHRRAAAELAAMGLDLLTTTSTPAAMALVSAMPVTPVVFVNVFDPVTAGLVASCERPGGHATGVAGFPADIAARWVSTLKEVAPGCRRVDLLFNPPTVALRLDADRKAAAPAAAALGLQLGETVVEEAGTLDAQLAALAATPDAGLVVIPHTFAFTHREAIIAAIARHRLPAIYGVAEMVRAGGLMSLGPDIVSQWREATWHMDRILRGASPGELPVLFADSIGLTVNRTAARELGLPLPAALLESAREILP